MHVGMFGASGLCTAVGPHPTVVAASRRRRRPGGDHRQRGSGGGDGAVAKKKDGVGEDGAGEADGGEDTVSWCAVLLGTRARAPMHASALASPSARASSWSCPAQTAPLATLVGRWSHEIVGSAVSPRSAVKTHPSPAVSHSGVKSQFRGVKTRCRSLRNPTEARSQNFRFCPRSCCIIYQTTFIMSDPPFKSVLIVGVTVYGRSDDSCSQYNCCAASSQIGKSSQRR